MASVAIVYYSAQGHTHELAMAVSAGLSTTAGIVATLVRLRDEDIQNGRWKNDAQIATLMAADTIVFGTPTYMGGYSAQIKAFIDGCGGIWFQQGWKDKLAAGFTHSQGLSGDKLNTLNGLMLNALQHGMVWVGNTAMPEGNTPDKVNRISSYSGVMAATYPGDLPVSDGDKMTAERFGKRIGEATTRWMKGK
jgi:NAD(P)H dehydrogenase (quinone)